MAYIATITSHISQFGHTDVTVRVIDSDNIMPVKYFSYTISTENPVAQDYVDIRNQLLSQAKNEYSASAAAERDAAQISADTQVFLDLLQSYCDSQIATVQKSFNTLATNRFNGKFLTVSQYEMAKNVVFSWQIKK